MIIINHAEIVHSGKESDLIAIVLNIILILNQMIYQFRVTTYILVSDFTCSHESCPSIDCSILHC